MPLLNYCCWCEYLWRFMGGMNIPELPVTIDGFSVRIARITSRICTLFVFFFFFFLSGICTLSIKKVKRREFLLHLTPPMTILMILHVLAWFYFIQCLIFFILSISILSIFILFCNFWCCFIKHRWDLFRRSFCKCIYLWRL